MKLIISSILTLLFVAGHAQQSNPLVVDESKTDASFMAFKAQLHIAVQKKDVELLLPLLADSVRESSNNPCQYCPKQYFVQMVCVPNKQRPNDAYFWQQTELLLKYGFKKGDEQNPSYIANYVHANQYFTAPAFTIVFDDYDTLLVLEETVKVYNAPTAQDSAISTISYGKYATVNTSERRGSQYDFWVYNADEDANWAHIALPNGKTGYVLVEKTSVALYKEMTVAKINGQWKIVSFYHPPGC